MAAIATGSRRLPVLKYHTGLRSCAKASVAMLFGMEGMGYGPGFAAMTALLVAETLFAFYAVRPMATPGVSSAARLARVLPCVCVNAVVPSLLFDPSIAIMGTLTAGFIVSWLLSFRLLALALNRGAAAHPAASTLGVFGVCLVLPMVVQLGAPRSDGPSKGTDAAAEPESSGTMAARGLFKVALVVATIRAFPNAGTNPVQRWWVYGLIVYLTASLMMDLSAAAARAVLGIRVAPHFNAPFFATSLRDFWANRWNLTVSTLLRDTIYLPIVSNGWPVDATAGAGIKGNAANRAAHAPSPILWRALGLLACFLASGACHELIMFHGTHHWSFEWFWFFLLHGVAVSVEEVLRRQLPNVAAALPKPLCVVLTVTFVTLSAEWLFFPPIRAGGIDLQTMDTINRLYIPIVDG